MFLFFFLWGVVESIYFSVALNRKERGEKRRRDYLHGAASSDRDAISLSERRFETNRHYGFISVFVLHFVHSSKVWLVRTLICLGNIEMYRRVTFELKAFPLRHAHTLRSRTT